jgi:hypothetical protein
MRNLGANDKIILKLTVAKQIVGLHTGFNSLRIGHSGGLL